MLFRGTTLDLGQEAGVARSTRFRSPGGPLMAATQPHRRGSQFDPTRTVHSLRSSRSTVRMRRRRGGHRSGSYYACDCCLNTYPQPRVMPPGCGSAMTPRTRLTRCIPLSRPFKLSDRCAGRGLGECGPRRPSRQVPQRQPRFKQIRKTAHIVSRSTAMLFGRVRFSTAIRRTTGERR